MSITSSHLRISPSSMDDVPDLGSLHLHRHPIHLLLGYLNYN